MSLPDYAELHCLSNFSFQRGASHPEELVTRAAELGLEAIAITDRNSLAGVVRAFRAGACDFLEKPCNEQQLLDSVQQALRRQRERLVRAAAGAALHARLASLTPRERDVLLPLVQGYTSREIAERLGVSVKTVELYRMRVMKRMQAERLGDLVGMACVAGLIDPLDPRGAQSAQAPQTPPA